MGKLQARHTRPQQDSAMKPRPLPEARMAVKNTTAENARAALSMWREVRCTITIACKELSRRHRYCVQAKKKGFHSSEFARVCGSNGVKAVARGFKFSHKGAGNGNPYRLTLSHMCL
jgi:hypothetical protein